MPSNDFTKDISPEKLEKLLNVASAKLGMSKDQLKATISDPKTADALLSRLSASNKSSLKSAMSSPQALEKLINSNPKAKELLRDILGG